MAIIYSASNTPPRSSPWATRLPPISSPTMENLLCTPIGQIPGIQETVKRTFSSGKTRPLAWRKNQLHQLARLVQENIDVLVDATMQDLGRPKQETLFIEIGPIIERSVLSAERLEEWAEPETPEVPDWQKEWRPKIYKASKGTVLIIAPWNYPIILSLQALIGAIAAGCTAVVKPSEVAPASAQLLAELFPKYLDTFAFAIVNGGVPETTRLLEMQWDHIFYTGNGRVARIVAAAAAKDLTPTTLELGGKSPVIIDPAYNMHIAAKRILWGKVNNAGQICVAPDYVLISRSKQDEFVAALKTNYDSFFPDGALGSASYGRIVNPIHHARLKSLLDRTKGTVVLGGAVTGSVGFEPTVVKDVRSGDSLMEEEIFGPILPIIPVDSIEDAIRFVNSRPHPLVVYPFTDDQILKQKLLEEIISGSIVFNDTVGQLGVSALPFSGIGESGHGVQVMKYTYDAFTHLRASLDLPQDVEPSLEIRYAPYNEQSDGFKIMTMAVGTDIPPPKSH
ncbi:hypothetical protein PLICRDRAFT_155932 [Plicaturopsis crispa FD-325 SS-3]|nr:hypothetical protein PLICRDRAFT_155932 [Plicaturopsis crispa FD-325 SS-3]